MKKTLVCTAVAMLLVLAAAFAVHLATAGRVTATGAAAVTAGPIAASAGEGSEDAVAAAHSADEAGVRAPLAGEPQAGARMRLTGRCVAAEDEAPLGGVAVTLAAKWENDAWRAAFAYVAVPEPAALTTGADGRFTFHVPIVRGLVYRLELHPPNRLPRVTTLRGGELQEHVDLGDVAHPANVPCAGRVVDQHGRPLAGATLALMLPADLVALRHRRDWNSFGDSVAVETVTDDVGRFRFAAGLPSGTWRYTLGLDDRRVRIVDPPALMITSQSPDLVVHVHASEARQRLDVTVLDEHGRGVPGMPLTVRGHQIHWTRRTDATGHCAIHDVTGDCGPWQVSAAATATHAAIEPVHDVRCGSAPLVLRTTTLPGRKLRLRVVQAADERPVERFAIAFLRADQGCHRVRAVGTHPRGELEIPDAPVGGVVLRVIPEREDLAWQDVAVPAPSAAMQDVVVRLEHCLSVPVRVVDRNGTPVAGVPLELLHLSESQLREEERRFFATGYANDERAFFRLDREPDELDEDVDHGVEAVQLLSCATSDADGRARLYAPRAGMRLALRAAGAGCSPRLSPEFAPGEPVPAEVLYVVERCGEVHGRVTPAEVVQLRPLRVLLSLTESPWVRWPREGGAELDALGRFRIVDVPPGEWRVRLCVDHAINTLAEVPVRIAEGERCEVTLDAPERAPAAVYGHVRVDGAPVPGADLRVWLQAEEKEGGRRLSYSRQRLLDHDSRYRLEGVPAGEYVFIIGTRSGTLMSSPVTLRPGEDREFDLDLVTRRVRVRCVDAATGAPIANRQVFIDTRGGLRFEPVTDADGGAVLDFTPGDALWAQLAWDEPLQGPFAVPAKTEGDVVRIALRVR